MKLQTTSAEEEKVLTLELIQVNDEVQVIDHKKGWVIVTFKVEDGKVVLVRNAGVADDNVNTDDNERIVEVEE